MNFSKLIYQLNDIRCQINDGEHGETQAEICDVIAELRKFEGMTNGEVIKALFPNANYESCENFMRITSANMVGSTLIWGEWWDAPYKAESEEGDKNEET